MGVKNLILSVLASLLLSQTCLGQSGFLSASFSTSDTTLCIGSTACFTPIQNYAMDFDGVDDFIIIPMVPSLRPNLTVSLEAWVYFREYVEWVSIVGNVWDDGSDISGYDIGVGDVPGNRVEFVVSDGGITYGSLTTTVIPLFEWHHFAGTYDGTSRKLYMDGVLLGTSLDVSGPIDYTFPNAMRIGAFIDGDEDFKLNGLIDEVRIWNDVRTDAEIAANMNIELDGTEPGLIGLWNFNDGPGSVTVTDSSPGANTGTLTNMDPATDFVPSTALGRTYSWDFGDGSPISTDSAACHSYASAGTFTAVLTITDGDGTMVVDSQQVIVSLPSIDSTTLIDPSCTGDADGEITIHAGGFDGPFEYSLDSGATYSAVDDSSFTGLLAGGYPVRIRNSESCESSFSLATLNDPLPLSFLFSEIPVSCHDGTNGEISITASGGSVPYAYSIDTGATYQASASFPSLSPGSYGLIVQDIQGCAPDTQFVTLTNPTAMEVSTDPVPLICPGDSGVAVIHGTGGTPFSSGTPYLYSIDSGATYISDSVFTLPAGNYSLVIQDSVACVLYDSMTLASAVPAALSLGEDTVICIEDSLVLDAGFHGGTTLWSSGGTAQWDTVTFPGTYDVTITDSNSCVGRDTIVLTNFPILNPDLGEDTAICPGDSLILNAGAGSSYVWSEGMTTPTLTVFTEGAYFVDLLDINGCPATDSIYVFVSAALAVDIGSDTAICSGDSILLDAGNPGGTFLWSTGAISQTIWVDSLDTYWVEVVDGCSATDTLSLTVNAIAPVDLGPDSVLCFGESLTVDASPGVSFLWSTAATTPSITLTAAGTYQVSVTDVNGCLAMDEITLAFTSPLSIELGADTAICEGEDLILDAEIPDGTYTWSSGETTQSIAVNTAGIYWVLVEDGCSMGSDSILIQVDSLPVVDLGNDTTLCEGDSLFFSNVSMGGSYLWSTGSTAPVLSVSSGGIIWLNVTNSFGCTGSDTIEIEQNIYALSFSELEPSYCLSDADIPLSAIPAGGIFVGPGVSLDSFSPEIAGAGGPYGITYLFTDSDGCVSMVADSVEVMETVIASAGIDQFITVGSEAHLAAGDPAPGMGTWEGIGTSASILEPNNPTSQVTGLEAGVNTFRWTVTLGGCVHSDEINVTYHAFPSEIGFSPNNDGVNDRFYIPGVQDFPGTELQVFMRWGEEVYRDADYKNTWEGKNMKGIDLPDDTYFFVLNLTTGETFKGFVVIHR